jgi:acid phosphatase type 7
MLAAGVIAPPAAPAWAAQTRLRARADTYVDAARPHRAFGHRKVLRVSSSPRRRAYLRFEVPLGESSLTRARLRLSVDRGAGRLKVRRLSSAASWSERRTTYARAPRAAGRAIRARVLRHAVVVDVTRFVKRGRSANLELSGGRDVRLWSRESRRPPTLHVATAPAPRPQPTPPPPPQPGPPPPPSGPVVAAAGDIACSPADPSFNGGLGTPGACAEKRTSDLLMGGGLAAVLALGDIQYGDGNPANYQASFGPTWGRVKPLIHPVPGNEDHINGDASVYFDYFNGIGASTGPAGTRGLGYYSFDVGGWHLIALNSNCTTLCSQGSAEEQWLAADLRAHPTACTLAYWHHPRWTSSADVANDADVSALWNDLVAAGADVVLNGHAHLYERFAPQGSTSPTQLAGTPDPDGIREFVVGTGGESHQTLGAAQANSEVRNANTFGVLELTLQPGSYAWRFVPEAGGTFTDGGQAPCH